MTGDIAEAHVRALDGPKRVGRRRRIIAAILSFCVPGLGQIYKGEVLKGIIWGVCIPTLVLMTEAFGVRHRFSGLVATFALQLIVGIAAALDGGRAHSGQRLEANNWGTGRRVLATLLAFLCIASLDALAVRSLKTRMFKVSAGPMSPTIRLGDRIAVDLAYYNRHEPQRGDVVAVRSPVGGIILVKRVVAMGGEEVTGKQGDVFINGRRLQEPYAVHTGRPLPSLNNFGPIRLRDGSFYVLGDNRDGSWDSRSPDFGPIDRPAIVGKVLYIYWSRSISRFGKTVH